MIYHDRVVIRTGGGRDDKGNPIPFTDEGPYRAQVTPIRSSESVVNSGTLLVLYYRLTIGTKAGAKLTPTGQVKWQNRILSIQGDVEPWMVNGRLHHFEATLRSG